MTLKLISIIWIIFFTINYLISLLFHALKAIRFIIRHAGHATGKSFSSKTILTLCNEAIFNSYIFPICNKLKDFLKKSTLK